MSHDVTNQLSHFLGIRTIFFDRALIDVDGIRQDVAIEGVAARQIDATIEAVQGIRRLDPHVLKGLVVRPVLDDHGNVGELLPEGTWELFESGFDQVLELGAGHDLPKAGRAEPRAEALDAAEPFYVDDVLDLANALHDVLQLVEVVDLDHEVVQSPSVLRDRDLGLGDVAVP